MGAPQYEQAGADIGGTGTTNTIPRWTGASTLGDSIITQSGTNRIGVTGAIWCDAAGGVGGVAFGMTDSASIRQTGTNAIMYFDASTTGGNGQFVWRSGNSLTERWRINSSGNLLAGADNTYDIGASGATRPRTVYVGTSIGIGANPTASRALTTVADLDVFGVRVGRGGDASQTSSVAVGASALGAASTGAQNTAVGFSALSVATGANNTAIGSNTLSQAFSGNNNTAIGVAAILPASSTASGNTAVGMEALRSHTSGNSNTAIGWRAGYGAASANANTTGSDNIYVGRETVGTANNNTNEIVIGAGATGNGSNTVTIGNSSNVGTFLDTKYVRIVDSYTVATLPVAGTAGRIARVTDGDAALAWGATVVNTGAGATPYLVWDNGTNWTVFGK